MINQMNMFGPIVTMERRRVEIDKINGLNQLLPGAGLASIQIIGALQEPILIELHDGRYRIADGKGRIRAAIDRGEKEIDVKVVPLSENISGAAMAAITVISNLGRRRNPVAEALAVREAVVQYAADEQASPNDPLVVERALGAFAAAMGVNVTQIEALYRITLIPNELLEASLNGEIAPTVIERLAGKSPEFIALALETFREMGTLTGKILRELSIAAARRAVEDLEAREPGMFSEHDAGGAPDDREIELDEAERELERAARMWFLAGGTVRYAREVLKSANAATRAGGDA